MKFFSASDFYARELTFTPDTVASMANAKLEREGRVVYADADNHPWHNVSFQGQTHLATVINIQPIPKTCTHPFEEINSYQTMSSKGPLFACGCGAKLRATAFQEIQEQDNTPGYPAFLYHRGNTDPEQIKPICQHLKLNKSSYKNIVCPDCGAVPYAGECKHPRTVILTSGLTCTDCGQRI